MATQYTAGLSSGQVLTAATMNSIGAAWESYTPTLTQGVTVTKTINYARYCQLQKLVIVQGQLTITSAGTALTEVVVGLPLTASTFTSRIVGPTYIYDQSAFVMYNCSAYLASATTVKFFYQNGTGWGYQPNIALANTDQISFSLCYEAA